MKPSTENYLVISAIAKQQSPAFDSLTETCTQAGCNIDNIRMTLMGEEVCMILLLSGSWGSIAKLEAALPVLEAKFPIQLLVKRTTSLESTQKSMPYAVQVTGLDKPGILYEMVSFLSQNNVSIIDIQTETHYVSRCLSKICTLHFSIMIPESEHISQLRDKFLIYCEDRNLDAILDPLKY